MGLNYKGYKKIILAKEFIGGPLLERTTVTFHPQQIVREREDNMALMRAFLPNWKTLG